MSASRSFHKRNNTSPVVGNSLEVQDRDKVVAEFKANQARFNSLYGSRRDPGNHIPLLKLLVSGPKKVSEFVHLTGSVDASWIRKAVPVMVNLGYITANGNIYNQECSLTDEGMKRIRLNLE